MNRCEDYPCCGHGPAPLGDDGGCPDAQGRFNCVLCGRKMPRGATSATCNSCRTSRSTRRDRYEEISDYERAGYTNDEARDMLEAE